MMDCKITQLRTLENGDVEAIVVFRHPHDPEFHHPDRDFEISRDPNEVRRVWDSYAERYALQEDYNREFLLLRLGAAHLFCVYSEPTECPYSERGRCELTEEPDGIMATCSIPEVGYCTEVER